APSALRVVRTPVLTIACIRGPQYSDLELSSSAMYVVASFAVRSKFCSPGLLSVVNRRLSSVMIGCCGSLVGFRRLLKEVGSALGDRLGPHLADTFDIGQRRVAGCGHVSDRPIARFAEY